MVSIESVFELTSNRARARACMCVCVYVCVFCGPVWVITNKPVTSHTSVSWVIIPGSVRDRSSVFASDLRQVGERPDRLTGHHTSSTAC